MLGPTAHIDTFARDNLPPPDQWPDFRLEGFDYPEHLNAAVELTDRMVERGFGDHTALIGHGRRRTYKELADWSNRLARALVEDYGVKPGNRVLIRSANNPAMIACWLAATKAGAVVVNTMPMLRVGELTKIVDKAEIKLALCDTRILDELVACAKGSRFLKSVVGFDGTANHDAELDRVALNKTGRLRRRAHGAGRRRAARLHLRHDRRAEGDDALSSRHPHNRRRLCEAGACRFGRRTCSSALLRSPSPSGSADSPCFRCASAPAAVLIESATPPNLVKIIEAYKATVCFTAPTAYRAMLASDGRRGRSFLASRGRVRGRDASGSGLRSLDEAHRRADPRRHGLDGNAACVHRQPS